MRDWASRIVSNGLYGKQITILLGSGASIQYVPGTGEVTTALKNWTKYCVPPASGIGFPNILDRIECAGAATQVRYFEGLYNALAPHFSDPQNFLHFERLIHIAQGLDYHTHEVVSDNNDYFKVGSGPLTSLKPANPWLDNKIHTMIASAATTFILDQFASRESAASRNYALKDDSLNKFLADLSKKFYLRVFTLNYDTVPLHSSVPFETGYHRSGDGVQEESFYPSRVRNAFRNHIFCQLHGSSRFGYSSGDRRTHGLIVRLNDHDSAVESRATTACGNNFGQDGVEGISQLMITGLRKADAILHDPFATYFSRFTEDLLNSEAILVVGYGGGDKHVNELFGRMYELRSERAQKTRLAWVGFTPPNIYNTDGVARDGIETEPWHSLSQASAICLTTAWGLCVTPIKRVP